MKTSRLHFLVLPLAALSALAIGCDGGDLGKGTTDVEMDMAGMDMAVAETEADSGPEASTDATTMDTAVQSDVAVDTSMAGMEM